MTDCVICRTLKGMLSGAKPKDFIAEDEYFAVSVESVFSSSKGHSTVRTKEHKKDVRELSKDEWNSLLSLVQEVTRKIDRVYHPAGFILMMPTGSKGSQSIKHFYMRVIPKYKKGYGLVWPGRQERIELAPTPAQYQEIKNKLEASGQVIGEKEKSIAKLVDQEKALDKGHFIITSKSFLSADISQIDPETWTQMGELLQENMKKCQDKLGVEDFQIHIALGKMTAIEDSTNSDLQIHVTPRAVKPKETDKFVMESKRISRKILDPDNPEYSYRDKTNQLVILEREIKELENKSTRTKAEESLLESKKKAYKKQRSNSNTTEANPSGKIALYIGLGVIIGVILISLAFIFTRKKTKGTRN